MENQNQSRKYLHEEKPDQGSWLSSKECTHSLRSQAFHKWVDTLVMPSIPSLAVIWWFGHRCTFPEPRDLSLLPREWWTSSDQLLPHERNRKHAEHLFHENRRGILSSSYYGTRDSQLINQISSAMVPFCCGLACASNPSWPLECAFKS